MTLLFIDRGYHTLLTCFWLFLRKYLILERRISGCEWETYEPSIGTNISKRLRWVDWSKKWYGQAPLRGQDGHFWRRKRLDLHRKRRVSPGSVTCTNNLNPTVLGSRHHEKKISVAVYYNEDEDSFAPNHIFMGYGWRWCVYIK